MQKHHHARGLARGYVSLLTLGLGAFAVSSAFAQEPSSESAAVAEETEEITVTGYRAALRGALDVKRQSGVMVDAINSDDIADFPDANLAESLQRIPGISIDRDQGEGRTITVRGLPGDFTRVRINGLEALSTAGANDAGSSPNRSRSFDFNTFASELFSSLKVQKTSSAETDEGSLGATVDLTTGRPMEFKEFQLGFSAEDSYYENGEFHNPKLAGLVSWHNEKFGALLSAAYSERQTEIDQFRRGPGVSDFTYRQTDFLGNEAPQRSGFSAPVGTNFGTVITNPAAIAAQTGSDPAAYARLYPGAPYNTPGRFDDSTVKFPALGSIEQSNVKYDRLGVTNSYQWAPSDRTQVNLDLLYSEYEYENIINQVSTVGLNRNNTNATYNTATAATTVANRRGLYPGLCTFNDGNGTAPPQDCGQAMFGTTPVAGYTFSLNPNNLDPYEYYNNPLSPGMVADPSGRGLGFRDALIGRPAVDVLDSNVSNGVADYLVLRNVDMRSAADASFYTTTFKQASLNVTHEFSDDFRMNLIYGQSESLNESTGLLVEFNSMDTPGPFVYDERGGGPMPLFDLGFDAANPENWGIVKGFSAMRHFKRIVENTYDGGRIDFTLDLNDKLNLGFGYSDRQYSFKTQQRERNTDTINPTELEAGVTTASLGSVFEFGQGLDAPAGTPSQFFAPDLEAFDRTFGFACACINEYGDFRTIRRNNGRDDFAVIENDHSVWMQLNFNAEMFGRRLYGNVGIREAFTALDSLGNSNGAGGLPIRASNDYTDTLPALNIAYEAAEDFIVRIGAAKVMARPLLGNLAPTITALSVPNTPGATDGGSLTIGNPYLSPFRGVNYDLSLEWYFTEGGLLSGAYFVKDIDSFPQTVIFDAPLSTFLDPAGIAQVRAGFTNPNQLAYIDADNVFRARQFRDAPGGELSGYELSYQQDFTFLPGFLKNFGAQLNYTHIDSELNYILDPGNGGTIPQTTAKGPWLGSSPNAINFTLYYEVSNFSARVSLAQREGYFTTYPLASGTCSPGIIPPIPASPDTVPPGGYCNSPLVNDFAGSEDTSNVDASVRWNVLDNLSLTLEALNLTNQTTDRYAYVDNPMVTQYGSTGRQYTFGVRYRY
jgi:iron complex outermembrane receptor protein